MTMTDEKCDCATDNTVELPFDGIPEARYFVICPVGNWWAHEYIEREYGIDVFYQSDQDDQYQGNWITSIHTDMYAIIDFETKTTLEEFQAKKIAMQNDDHLKGII